MPTRRGSKAFARALGERIRALRLEAGVTQEKLAWACDLDKGYMSQIEAGKRLPSLPVLCEIAAELGLELVDIVVAHDPGGPRAGLVEAARVAAKDDARAFPVASRAGRRR